MKYVGALLILAYFHNSPFFRFASRFCSIQRNVAIAARSTIVQSPDTSDSDMPRCSDGEKVVHVHCSFFSFARSVCSR